MAAGGLFQTHSRMGLRFCLYFTGAAVFWKPTWFTGQVLHKAVEPLGPSHVGSMAEDCAVDSCRPCLLREF